MSIVKDYPHLAVDSDGVVRIANSRYTALHIAGEHYHYGWTADEILRQHSDLQPAEVYAALTWLYDHYADVVETLSSQLDDTTAPFEPPPFSRAELVRRRAGKGT